MHRIVLTSGSPARLPSPSVDQLSHFDLAFRAGLSPVGSGFGITPATAWLEVGDEDFEAHFGPWRVITPLANITEAAVNGPYALPKTAAPMRLAITNRELTFATNCDRGVLISFSTPVRGLDPLGILRHPELTVTVADVDRLAALLRAAVDDSR